MSGGNPVKKAKEEASRAVDSVGNFAESAVSKTRDEVGRNLGSDAQKALQAASDIAVAPIKQTGQGISNINQGFIETAQGNVSPGFKQIKEGAKETSMGVALPQLAMGKEALSVGKELLGGNRQLPSIATDTGTNYPVATPTPEKTAEELAQDQYMQDQLASSRRKGRASTQLTGPQGLSGSTSYSARRTLLGV